MGIRFRCHQCGHELHVKDFQGGKRSRCPECDTRFRIPSESAELSIPLDGALSDDSAVRSSNSSASSSVGSTGTLASKAAAAKSSAGSSGSSSPASTKAAAVATEKSAARNFEESTASEVEASAAEQVGAPGALMQLRAIAEAPSATWYVRPPAGGQYGPAPANVFCEWLTESRVTRDSLVWRDGWPQWLMASDAFPEYFGPSSPAAATVPAPISAPVAYPQVAPATPAHSAATYSPAAEQTGASEFVAPVTLSDRTLAARKRQRKKNYLIMIGVLATISVGLVIALAVILLKNA